MLGIAFVRLHGCRQRTCGGSVATTTAVVLRTASRCVFTSIASAASSSSRRGRAYARAVTRASPSSSSSSTTPTRVHALSSDVTAAYNDDVDDSNSNSSSSRQLRDAAVSSSSSSYVRWRHNAFALLYCRQLWLPVVMAVGYYCAVAPLLATLSTATTSSSLWWWWCTSAYGTACVLLQRVCVRGRTCAVWRTRQHSSNNNNSAQADARGDGGDYVDMRDRVCVVTGGTSGIGLHVAAQLLDLGAHVVIAARPGKEASTMHFFATHCRHGDDNDGDTKAKTSDRDTTTTTTAAAATRPLSQRVSFVPLDLADPLRIVAAAAQLRAQHDDRLDVLVHCAAWRCDVAARLPAYGDDVEQHLAVNFLAPFHLTEALLPALRRARGRPGRVVYVTCLEHAGVRARDMATTYMKWPPPQRQHNAAAAAEAMADGCYRAAKLGNIYHAQSLATRPGDDDAHTRTTSSSSSSARVEVCCADPGWTATTRRGGDGATTKTLLGNSALARALRLLWLKTAREGSQTVLHCCVCTAPQPAGYYYECAYMPSGLGRAAHDAHARDAVMRWAHAKTMGKYYKARAH